MAIDERNIVFDFGFTAVSENELDAYQESQEQLKQVSGDAQMAQARLDRLFSAIQPHCFYNVADVPATLIIVFQSGSGMDLARKRHLSD